MKEKIIQLLEEVPEYKLGYILAYIQGMTAGEDVRELVLDDIMKAIDDEGFEGLEDFDEEDEDDYYNDEDGYYDGGYDEEDEEENIEDIAALAEKLGIKL